MEEKAAGKGFFLSVAGGAGVLAGIIFTAFITNVSEIKEFFSPPTFSYRFVIKLEDSTGAAVLSKDMPQHARIAFNGASVPLHRTDDNLVLIHQTTDVRKQRFVRVGGSLYFVSNIGVSDRVEYKQINIPIQNVSVFDDEENPKSELVLTMNEISILNDSKARDLNLPDLELNSGY